MEIEPIVKIGAESLNGVNLEFFKRVWTTRQEIFRSRLKAIDFYGQQRFFDAGCGFGQWSVAASALNDEVYAMDSDPDRVNTLSKILKELNLRNLHVKCESIEKTTFEADFFDAVFCYSSIYFSDFKKTINEFYRILKPGGRIYLCANGLGWYLHNLLEGHNDSESFSGREMAIASIENSINYFAVEEYNTSAQLIIPSKVMKAHLSKAGFQDIITGAEGTIRIKNVEIKPFYKESYFGKEGVYEILAWKKK